MKTLKEYVIELSKEKGWSAEDDQEMFETFEEFFDVVSREEYSEHRWYIEYRKVTKVTIDSVDRYFEWFDYYMRNEGDCRSDVGWETPDLDDLKEVFPEEVTVTVYQ